MNEIRYYTDENISRAVINGLRQRGVNVLSVPEAGMLGLQALKNAGCEITYIDGSFTTNKDEPKDFDVCWEVAGVKGKLLDPVLLTFVNGRAAQKAKYFGEFFPAESQALPAGLRYLDFFQINKFGQAKGIIKLDLRNWKDDN